MSSKSKANMQIKNLKDTNDSNIFRWKLMPVFFLDFMWVMIIYISTGIFLALLIDGYILEPISIESTKNKTTFNLYTEVVLQLSLQSLITIIIASFLQYIPSPFFGLYGYSIINPEAKIIRNPAIISVLLFNLSKSLKIRLNILFSRFDKNALVSIN